MSNPGNRRLDGCPRCDGQYIIDPLFVEQAQASVGKLLVELVAFAKKHKLDHTNMPVLGEVGQVIRELENL